MKKTSLYLIPEAFLAISVFLACKKEFSCEGCNQNNKPPIAMAGPDVVITLPTDSVLLDGNASSDPDGKISAWQWTKVSGPASFIINNTSSAKTTVKNLKAGTYQLELTVKDDGGLSAKDTVQITIDNPAVNQPPVACAGADQTITLPVNTVTLNGSCSADPDNNITDYQWTKIAGPASFTIANANAAQTQVSNFTEGTYGFELKVTDAGGLFSKDIVQVKVNPQPIACDNSNRPQFNVRLIPIGSLAQTRTSMAVASAGNKVVFAGGEYLPNGFNGLIPSSKVDVYDIATQTWTSAELFTGRYIIAAVANGNKIFFGGGEEGDGTLPVNVVDIYDVSTNTWTVSRLSTAGHAIAAAAVGNKVLFAGGGGGVSGPWRETRVDIYDLTTNTWSTASLSEGKIGHVAVTIGNKVYVAGGQTFSGNSWTTSNKVDVYDNASNTWSALTMLEPKSGMAGIAVDNKIYWAGGRNSVSEESSSCFVEVKDINTSNSSVQYLYQPAGFRINDGQNAVVKDNKIIFYSSFGRVANKFDIYDITTNTWSIGVLPVTIEGASIISVNNVVYLAGGRVNGALSDKVWKLEF